MGKGSLPPVIRQMLRPEFYPHPTSDRIVLMQTHISYVLLTGPYAYKVKKAVDLGFLDFSTLERRRHFCEEELRLNRRGAPGLYLEVLPVTQAADGAARLGGDGQALEFALKMRQFPQEGLLSWQVESGLLGEADLEALAGTVADYHAAAPPDLTGTFGHPEGLRDAIRQDHDQSERFVGRLQTRERLEQTRAFTKQFFSERGSLIEERVRQGRVRECHGDLHLSNICRLEGRTLLFDCIEFNESYRWIDTMHDAAFAAMDLEARGRPDLANAYVNAYAEQTGDWEGLRVLPLYLCRYAYVRAKVTSLLADDPAADEPGRDAAAKAATRYYELAWSYTRPRQGRLILMCGLSGSGKTTLARLLARRLGAIHIRSDAVRKHLAGVPLHGRAGETAYSPQMTDRTYRRLLALGLNLASDAYVVILDARYARAAARGSAVAAAAARNLPLRILHCTAPSDVLRERLRRRAGAGEVSDATPGLLARQAAELEPFRDAQKRFVRTLDTTRAPEQLAAELDRELAVPASLTDL
jgi:uncharacterized protein